MEPAPVVVYVAPAPAATYAVLAPDAEYAACAVTYATPAPVSEHVVQQLRARQLPLWSCRSPQSPFDVHDTIFYDCTGINCLLPVATISMCCQFVWRLKLVL